MTTNQKRDYPFLYCFGSIIHTYMREGIRFKRCNGFVEVENSLNGDSKTFHTYNEFIQNLHNIGVELSTYHTKEKKTKIISEELKSAISISKCFIPSKRDFKDFHHIANPFITLFSLVNLYELSNGNIHWDWDETNKTVKVGVNNSTTETFFHHMALSRWLLSYSPFPSEITERSVSYQILDYEKNIKENNVGLFNLKIDDCSIWEQHLENYVDVKVFRIIDIENLITKLGLSNEVNLAKLPNWLEWHSHIGEAIHRYLAVYLNYVSTHETEVNNEIKQFNEQYYREMIEHFNGYGIDIKTNPQTGNEWTLNELYDFMSNFRNAIFANQFTKRLQGLCDFISQFLATFFDIKEGMEYEWHEFHEDSQYHSFRNTPIRKYIEENYTPAVYKNRSFNFGHLFLSISGKKIREHLYDKLYALYSTPFLPIEMKRELLNPPRHKSNFLVSHRNFKTHLKHCFNIELYLSKKESIEISLPISDTDDTTTIINIPYSLPVYLIRKKEVAIGDMASSWYQTYNHRVLLINSELRLPTDFMVQTDPSNSAFIEYYNVQAIYRVLHENINNSNADNLYVIFMTKEENRTQHHISSKSDSVNNCIEHVDALFITKQKLLELIEGQVFKAHSNLFNRIIPLSLNKNDRELRENQMKKTLVEKYKEHINSLGKDVIDCFNNNE